MLRFAVVRAAIERLRGAAGRNRSRVPLRGLGAAAIGLLAGFHVWILIARLHDDTITAPAVALRWLGAAALIGLAGFFRRRGVPLLSGRSGLVFWALVLLLHVGATPVPISAVPAEELLAALPFALALPAAFAAASVLPGSAGSRRPRVGRWPRAACREPGPARPSDGFALRFLPRPPPVV